MFNKETYIQRRNRLKKEIGKGILLFLGNNESGMNYADNTYHFRQDSTFLYFFGSDYAGLSALIDIDEDREIIFGDELTIDDIVWMGTQPTIREKSASVGITATAPTAQLSDYLLILSHNKTLAAQLYSEFKAFFPNNAVEYFVSYYDYYQPEAYLPTTDTYIEKDLQINDEIDKLRLRATASLLSGRKDVIVVSSVSCLYGMADPTAFAEKVVHLEKGMRIDRDKLLRRFVDALYVNNKIEFNRGCFRVNGDTVDIFPAIETFDGAAYRIEFWDDEVDRISSFDPQTGQEIDEQDELNIYPTNLFVTTQERINTAIGQIDVDLGTQVNFLREIGKPYEAKRLYEQIGRASCRERV